VWAEQVVRHTGGKVLILCPVAVAPQTLREAEKFNIQVDVHICKQQSQVVSGITLTNYERLHLFDPSQFDGVVLDESSILKSYTGKTKQALCAAFANAAYRMACTATPAPNDRMELGNHSEFLGIMPSSEMLTRWFINDTMKAGGYRLMHHARKSFWEWMASWAVAISKPSDLGFADIGYKLPPLNITEHIVPSRQTAEGRLFADYSISATSVHQEKRSALADRADVVASLANADRDIWIVWCDTDYEADAITKRIPDAVEVRGSHHEDLKTERLTAFTRGEIRVLVTKSEIAGFGLNFQHCHKTTWFAGYSFERFYQAIRRLYRFGQVHPVECHIVMTEAEESIKKVIDRKIAEHGELQSEMALAMQGSTLGHLYGKSNNPLRYQPSTRTEIPAWLLRKSNELTLSA
jgi:superfamily II DNA or RNA helicase